MNTNLNHTVIDVATGEVKTAKAPAKLQCLALGSCVAVILYDNASKIGGIAHVMLPPSAHNDVENAGALRYANHAIDELVKQIRELEDGKGELTARLVGGALVIHDISDVGKENTKTIRKLLQDLGIRIIDEHIGGTKGRSVLFDVGTGELQINGKLILTEETTKSDNRETIVLKEKATEFTKGLEEQVTARTEELNERIKELDNTRKATLNLLEDMEKERGKLAEANARNEAMLISIGDGLVATDVDGKIILVNNAFENMLGWKESEIKGKLQSDVMPMVNEKGEEIPASDRLDIKASKKQTTTVYYKRKDGISFPVAVTISPIFIENDFIGTVEVFRDMTQEKKIEKLKDEFVSIASHELRTPLTAINGLISMILNGEYGEVNNNLKKPLKDVSISSQRLIHLVNDLLSLSRIQAGRLLYKLSDFPITQLVSQAAVLLKPIAESKGLQFETAEFEMHDVQADRDKVEQILDNLIGNSIKFTDTGSITLAMKADGERVNIYVTDTGTGITQEDQDQIFGMFQQLESTKGGPIGTGLGLHISREIARKMGGDLWIEKSEKGVGSTFAFSIPKSKSGLAMKVKEEITSEDNALKSLS